MVARVGNRIGHVRETNYGQIFDVIDLGESGNNLAQTNCRIRAHTDNPYRDPFPGVQLLHCLTNAAHGGATTFTDGFAVAARLQLSDPDAYNWLSAISHPFEYTDATQNLVLRAEVPVLTHDAHGELCRVTLNNRSAGCLPSTALDPAQLAEYYGAWATFDTLCNSDEFVLRLPLQPGDLAVFLNSRVMHGRDEYSSGKGRHIQGCYIDHDAIRSRMQWATVQRKTTAAMMAMPAEGASTEAEACTHPHEVHSAAMERMMAALASQASYSYGEGVTMLDHALQAAHCARQAGEADAAVLAALMHDVGNSPQAREHWQQLTGEAPRMMVSPVDQSIGYAKHADMGAAYVRAQGFCPAVASAVSLHVAAKRALVGMDANYMRQLSTASIDTLAQQGGPMSAEEVQEFQSHAGAEMALRLRRYDDEGKDPEGEVPRLEAYRLMMQTHLRQQTCAASALPVRLPQAKARK